MAQQVLEPVRDRRDALEQEVTLTLFNRARCECKEPVQISVELTGSGLAKRSTIGKGDVKLLLGPTDCVSANSA